MRTSLRIKFESCKETLQQLNVDPTKILVVLNKIDLLEHPDVGRIDENFFEGFTVVGVSSTRGDGIHRLKTSIIERIGS